ncbi:hypothetical protein AVEN_102211-1 [Araneus ventricosus]|uniref:Uncharacterized protein n=1 Tax=Araneus ventricosus TaxID=182803 RepID=A0A4Y2NIB5_ARAVE|nr:hypothetical protein AVEN_102211-1 [Araneus ventricosus]
MRSTRKKWCALWKLTPTLKYAEQYVFVGKRFMRTAIHSEISAVYRPEPHAMPRPAIVKWCQQFEDGRTDLSDAERQGRPPTVSKHIRHGAAGGRHHSQQWQNERRIHCTGFGNIRWQSSLRLSRVL